MTCSEWSNKSEAVMDRLARQKRVVVETLSSLYECEYAKFWQIGTVGIEIEIEVWEMQRCERAGTAGGCAQFC